MTGRSDLMSSVPTMSFKWSFYGAPIAETMLLTTDRAS